MSFAGPSSIRNLSGDGGLARPAREAPFGPRPRVRERSLAGRLRWLVHPSGRCPMATQRDLGSGQGRTDDLPDRRRPASGPPPADRRASSRLGRARFARLRRGHQRENASESAWTTSGPAKSAADGPALAGTKGGSLPSRSRLPSTSLRARGPQATPSGRCRTPRERRGRGTPRRLRSAVQHRSQPSNVPAILVTALPDTDLACQASCSPPEGEASLAHSLGLKELVGHLFRPCRNRDCCYASSKVSSTMGWVGVETSRETTCPLALLYAPTRR
jgi:hypothetical protein